MMARDCQSSVWPQGDGATSLLDSSLGRPDRMVLPFSPGRGISNRVSQCLRHVPFMRIRLLKERESEEECAPVRWPGKQGESRESKERPVGQKRQRAFDGRDAFLFFLCPAIFCSSAARRPIKTTSQRCTPHVYKTTGISHRDASTYPFEHSPTSTHSTGALRPRA